MNSPTPMMQIKIDYLATVMIMIITGVNSTVFDWNFKKWSVAILQVLTIVFLPAVPM